jgi:SAM-dependent methyltransferase
VTDQASGYDELAGTFARMRAASPIGASRVREWASTLGAGCEVLDVGCGIGRPITQALVDAGCRVWAIDASPQLTELFKARFPDVPVCCEAVEGMTHFERDFDGVVAWGLVFLLAPDRQRAAIASLARAVRAGGQLLFTAPARACQWKDATTQRDSYGLGAEVYRRWLEDAGLAILRTFVDEGDNHYYQAGRDAGSVSGR